MANLLWLILVAAILHLQALAQTDNLLIAPKVDLVSTDFAAVPLDTVTDDMHNSDIFDVVRSDPNSQRNIAILRRKQNVSPDVFRKAMGNRILRFTMTQQAS